MKLLILTLIVYLITTPNEFTAGSLSTSIADAGCLSGYVQDTSDNSGKYGFTKGQDDSAHTANTYTTPAGPIYEPGEPPLKPSLKMIKGSEEEKIIFLTIDDGPSGITSGFLEVLRKYNVHATFCITGNRVGPYSETIKRIYNEGHSIINHSHNHVYNQIYSSPRALIDSLKRCNAALDSVIQRTDIERSFMRFPGGAGMVFLKGNGRAFAEYLKSRGYHTLEWNIDSKDCSTGKVTMEFIRNNSIDNSGENMVVILMHDFEHRKVTIEALLHIIEHYKKNGYVFRTIRDMTPSDLEGLKMKGIVDILY